MEVAMRVKDVMSGNPVTIPAEATVAEAIALMLKNRISGLPVVERGNSLVGIVSESDFLRRIEMGTLRRERWLEWLLRPSELAAEYAHTRGRHVADVMTADVISVAEDTDLAEVVEKMQAHHIKRLPVLRKGIVVGMITRSDLMRGLANLVTEPYEDVIHTDAEIHSAILAELDAQAWAPVAAVAIKVKDGVVTLHGNIHDERQRAGLKVLAMNVPGVRSVEDRLVWIEPYTGTSL
jgi:CBS domain-containing protein